MSRQQSLPILRHYLFILIAISFLIGITIWSTSTLYAIQPISQSVENSQDVETTIAPRAVTLSQCGEELPTLSWLGEGPANYPLAAGFDTFIVKREPFSFHLDAGQQTSSGQTVYQAAPNERVWSCRGNCQLPAIFHETYVLGTFTPGTIINMVVIDDDGVEQGNDQRRNWWAVNDPLVPFQLIEIQEMVEYLTFEIPEAGEWFYYANDSVGIAATCVEPVTPTSTPMRIESPTPMPTHTPTSTPTHTSTSTNTPMPTSTHTATATATAIPPTPSMTATPSVIATPIPSATPGMTATNTPASEPTSTPTSSPTATKPPVTVTQTPTGFATPTVTPAITPRQPTALSLAYLMADTEGTSLRVQWETTLEVDLRGFRLWRSITGQRADAVQITPNLLHSRGTASNGATYRFDDTDVTYGVTYTYWLEQVGTADRVEDADATTAQLMHTIFLPLVER